MSSKLLLYLQSVALLIDDTVYDERNVWRGAHRKPHDAYDT